MAKISNKTINNLEEFMNRDCDYAGTQEVVDNLVYETLMELGSKYPYGDEIGLVDVDGEFDTVSEFANVFWDKTVVCILNVLKTEE